MVLKLAPLLSNVSILWKAASLLGIWIGGLMLWPEEQHSDCLPSHLKTSAMLYIHSCSLLVLTAKDELIGDSLL
jgi:hypothetical protein